MKTQKLPATVTTENQEFIYESIVQEIQMGFNSIEEVKQIIYEEIEDNSFENEISEKWADALIMAAYKEQVIASKSWTQPTATDKLIKAFDRLCDDNIIALHNAGYTTSDGEIEVAEVERALRKNNIKSDGYCFYHQQDLNRALCTENSSLYIAFNKLDNEDNEVTIAIGKRIIHVLEANGFTIEWNESPTQKINILDFAWQRKYHPTNRNLWDYERVIQRMLKNKS